MEAKGRAGGLALFWGKEADVKVIAMDDHFIDFHVCVDGERTWRGTGVYGWAENG